MWQIGVVRNNLFSTFGKINAVNFSAFHIDMCLIQWNDLYSTILHFIAPTIITLNDIKACHNPTCYCAMMYIKKQEERISERDTSLNELETPPQRGIQQDGLYIIKKGDGIHFFLISE